MYEVEKCDWCKCGHKNGIKILVIQGKQSKFCDSCGPQIKMVNAETGEESNLMEIWHDSAGDE